MDDLADQGEDPESDEVLASFDGYAGNNQAAITDGTILDIRHGSADDSQADDVLLTLLTTNLHSQLLTLQPQARTTVPRY